MRSILLVAVAMAISATSTASAAPPDPDQGTGGPVDSPANGLVEMSGIPTFVCGAVVDVDTKTVQDKQEHDRVESDGCRVSPKDDGGVSEVQVLMTLPNIA